MLIFVIIITAFYCPLRKYTIQEEHVFKREQWAWLLTATLAWNVGLAEAQDHLKVLGLPHRVHRYYDICLNIGCLSIKKKHAKQKFRHEYYCHHKYIRQYFQHLVDKGFIKAAWTPFCINFVYQSTFLHHRLCNMHTICCLHHVGKILTEIKKTGHALKKT